SEMKSLFDLQERSGAETAQAATRAAVALSQWKEIDATEAELRDHEASLLRERQARGVRRTGWLVAFIVAGMLSSIVLIVALTPRLSRENRRARRLQREAAAAVEAMQRSNAQRDRLSEQRHELSRYAGMLQSCGNRDEIMQLTAATIRRLVPQASGQCYVLRPSRDFHESVAAFGDHVVSSSDLLQAHQCWALRRGQTHYLRDGGDGMRCGHIDSEASLAGIACLCVPLVAQGAQVGLLHVSAPASGEPGDGDAEII